MKTKTITFVLAIVLSLAVAAPAYAASGAGKDFGQHHAAHAQEMGGFTAEMNPGVMHQGFAGWGM